MSRRKNRNSNSRSTPFAFLRKPAAQLAIVILVAFLVYLIAAAGGNDKKLASEVNVDQAYQMYQSGALIIDLRTQQEWDEYHAPNTLLVPLDQLSNRLNQIPKDRQIVVVCRSSNCSQAGRDILIAAGYNAASMNSGLQEWFAKGYPIEGAPVQ